MQKYDFDKIISRKNTNCTKWDYTKEKFGKEGLLPLAISDMDFQSPPAIIEAIKKRAEHGIFGYTRWENEEYRNSIINWYKKRINYKADKSWLAYGSNTLYLLAQVLKLYNPKQEDVALFTPYYNYFHKLLVNNGYPIKGIEITEDITTSNFEKQVKNSKVFLLCNPNNPCGRLWDKASIKYMVEICKKHNTAIISDEIYMDIVYKPNKFTTILEVAQELDYLDKTSVVTASSKVFNLSGLGGAYGFIPNQTIREKLEDISESKEIINAGLIFGLVATVAGYNEGEQWLEELLQYLEGNLIFAKEYIDKNIPILSTGVPQATYFAWIDCSKLPHRNDEIQDILMNKGNLGLMDGKNNYNTMQNFLRMNVACPRAIVKEALDRLAICFGDYKV